MLHFAVRVCSAALSAALQTYVYNVLLLFFFLTMWSDPLQIAMMHKITPWHPGELEFALTSDLHVDE